MCITNYLYAKRKAGKKYIKISKIIGEPLNFCFPLCLLAFIIFTIRKTYFLKNEICYEKKERVVTAGLALEGHTPEELVGIFNFQKMMSI